MPGLKTTEEIITEFNFEGKTHLVAHGKEVIKFLVDELANRDPWKVDLLAMDLRRKRKSWIKEDGSSFDRPYLIRGTKWYIDTNMSTANIKKKAKLIVTYFGYTPDKITFKSRHIAK